MFEIISSVVNRTINAIAIDLSLCYYYTVWMNGVYSQKPMQPKITAALGVVWTKKNVKKHSVPVLRMMPAVAKNVPMGAFLAKLEAPHQLYAVEDNMI